MPWRQCHVYVVFYLDASVLRIADGVMVLALIAGGGAGTLMVGETRGTSSSLTSGGQEPAAPGEPEPEAELEPAELEGCEAAD